MNNAASSARRRRFASSLAKLPSQATSPRTHAAQTLHSAHLRGLAWLSRGNRSEPTDGFRLCFTLPGGNPNSSNAGTLERFTSLQYRRTR